MANYANLKSAIQQVIKTNGNNEITGALLQQSLLAMINSLGAYYQFIGIATPETNPETNPGTPDQRVFYIGSAGTYPNFGPAVVPDGNMGVFYYDSGWHFGTVAFPIGAGTITETNLASSLVNKLFSTGYKFVGIATPSTSPGTPDQNVFYIGGAGTYSNFSNLVVPAGHIGALKYNGTWALETVQVGDVNAVKFVEQALTDAQKAQARTNIEAASSGQVSQLEAKVDTFVDYTDTPTVNIFDKSAATLNYYVNKNTGNLASLADYDATDYIPIDSRGLYFDKAYGGGVTIGCAVYNSSKQYIRGYVLDKQITFQEGDAYVRFTLKHQKIDVAMCVAGTSADLPAEYVPYRFIRSYNLKDDIIDTDNVKDKAITKEKLADDVMLADTVVSDLSYQSPNLFDKMAAREGVAVSATSGALVSHEGYYASDYISIPEDATTMYQAKGWSSYAAFGWACYNSSKVYTHGGTTQNITFQEGDAFICITLDADNLNTEMLVVGTASSVPDHYVPYGIIEKYQLKENTVPFAAIDFRTIEIGKNKLNPEGITDNAYINKSTGTLINYSSSPSISATGYVPVSERGLYFNAFFTGGTAIGAAVYDVDKVYIRSIGQTYVYEEGDAFVRYSLLTSNKTTAQVEEGSVATEYENYTERVVINPDYIPNNTNDIDEETEIPVVLPQKIFAVVGDTLQVFFKQCVQAVEPLRYNILVACSKGRQYHRYFEYTPVAGDIGETAFDLYVKDDLGQIVGHGSCRLVTVAVPSSPVTTKKILCVGDSLTANGVWVAEAYRRLTGSGGTPAGNELTNISFVGSMGTGDAKYLGNSGWSWKSYCTDSVVAFRFTVGPGVSVNIGAIYSNNSYNYTVVEVSDNGTILCTTPRSTNTPQASGILTKVSGGGDMNISYSAYSTEPGNPFWDGTKLSFVPYVNTYCGGSIDEVFVLLGGNGLVNWKNDFSDYIGYMEDFADTLHAEYPSAKLVLMGMQFPSMELMMPGYGASGILYADTYGILASIARLRDVYKEFASRNEYSGFVSAIDIGCQFDGDYNYWEEEKAVNTRKTNITEPYDYNTLHPDNDGYKQYADAVYRKLAYDLQ